MAQFGRPSTDTHVANWERSPAGGSLFTAINDASPNDGTAAQTVEAPASAVYVTKMTTLEDPGVDTGHIVRYRYGKNAAGGAQIDLTVELRQAYVSEGTPGTLIKQWVHTNIAETLTTAAQTLSESEAGTITDYTNLYLRFVGNQP